MDVQPRVAFSVVGLALVAGAAGVGAAWFRVTAGVHAPPRAELVQDTKPAAKTPPPATKPAATPTKGLGGMGGGTPLPGGGMGAGMAGRPGAGGMIPPGGPGAMMSGGSPGGMGMMGMMGGPQAGAAVATNHSIAIESLEKDGVRVYDVDAGTWADYKAAKGMSGRPIASVGTLAQIAAAPSIASTGSPGLIAVAPTGPEITELAAYSESTRAWAVQPLKEPVKPPLSPSLGQDLAIYVVGRRVYAFSGMAGKWGVLELEEGARIAPTFGPRVAMVEHKGVVHLFNAKFARWDSSSASAK
jgi:hypothetical protein